MEDKTKAKTKTKEKVVDWIELIRAILKLIGDGLSEAAAISTIASLHRLPINEVKKHFKKR